MIWIKLFIILKNEMIRHYTRYKNEQYLEKKYSFKERIINKFKKK